MKTPPYAPAYEESILDHDGYSLVQADSGKRLANWLIDIVFFYCCVFIFLFIKSLITEAAPIPPGTSPMALRIFSVLCFLIFTSVIETLTGGKSLGKYLTGTRAVNEDGSRLDGTAAFMRSLFRVIPFEPLSALGKPPYPWHDRLSRTYVVDEKLSRLP
jgi:uncharacterized RDD family membrane protein YckC